MSAYAAICKCSGADCECGSLCCDGYTEFCCTISGANRCPPGSVTAGWWKVGSSSFCAGGARYYLDCNAVCGDCGCGANGLCEGGCTGTPCGCANGDCDHRKVGCTHFRYGQCNTQACVGPIICRVVSCQPPWEFDPACGTTVLVDENTATHNAPCLEERVTGGLDLALWVSGAGIRVRGWAADSDTTAPVALQVYVGSTAFDIGKADRPHEGDSSARFGPNRGFDAVVPWSAAGSHRVCVFAVNVDRGVPNSLLGCGEVRVPSRRDRSPIGALEAVSWNALGLGLRVRGWAADRDAPDPIGIEIHVGSSVFNIGRADRPRPDVADRFPGMGPNHGFDAVVPWVTPGRHRVCAVGLNAGAQGADRTIGCRDAMVVIGPPGGG